MRGSEIQAKISSITQLRPFFAGISTIDCIPTLEEDDFTIVNTEYVFEYLLKEKSFTILLQYFWRGGCSLVCHLSARTLFIRTF